MLIVVDVAPAVKLDDRTKAASPMHHRAASVVQVNDDRRRKIIVVVTEVGDPLTVVGIDMIGEAPIKIARTHGTTTACIMTDALET